MQMRNALVFVGIGAIVIAFGWWFLAHQQKISVQNMEAAPPYAAKTFDKTKPVIEEQGAAIGGENLVSFTCDHGKVMTAVFERDIVGLTLSDGRQITLRQAQSGSGIRYLSNDATIEFSGKGNEGDLIENAKTTYAHCVATN